MNVTKNSHRKGKYMKKYRVVKRVIKQTIKTYEVFVDAENDEKAIEIGEGLDLVDYTPISVEETENTETDVYED